MSGEILGLSLEESVLFLWFEIPPASRSSGTQKGPSDDIRQEMIVSSRSTFQSKQPLSETLAISRVSPESEGGVRGVVMRGFRVCWTCVS